MKLHWIRALSILPAAYLARKIRTNPQLGANAGAMKDVNKQGAVVEVAR